MAQEIILENSFFAFWHTFGEYFIVLIAFAIVVCFVAGFIYVLTKR